MTTARQLEDALGELILPLVGMSDIDEEYDRYARAAELGRLNEILAEDLIPYLDGLDHERRRSLYQALLESLSRSDVAFDRVLGGSLVPTFGEDDRAFFSRVAFVLESWATKRSL